MTIPTAPPSSRTIDYAGRVREVWGDEWLKADTAYEFSNGRKFEVGTGAYTDTLVAGLTLSNEAYIPLMDNFYGLLYS